MAQMTRCPRCGADNSARRATCYACGAPLGEAQQPPAAPSTEARDRFAAAIRERSGMPAGAPSAPAPAPAPAAPSLLPTFYGTIGQVGRARHLFRQLHALVESGHPVADALRAMARSADRSVRRAARAMAQSVTDGGKLSDAMRAHPGLVLAYQVEMVRAAEMAGALPQALDAIAADCEAEFRLRKAVLLAMMPTCATVFVMLLVGPVALVLREPPPGEYWTLRTIGSHYLGKALTVSVPIALGLGGLWAGWRIASRSRAAAVVLQRLLLSLPLIGGAHRRTAMMRFLGSLSMLLNAGVPVAEAYRTAAAATGNPALARQLAHETDNLYAGRGLVDTLNRLRLLPREALDHMAIGETTGKLPQVLAHVAATHRGQVERSAKYLPHLLQLIAYAVIVPVALLLWFTLFNVFVHYRLSAPLEHLFDVP